MTLTQPVTTEWPWPWHPDIHWYHEYLNLSSVGPDIWDGLHLGVLTSYARYNESHPAVKWFAGVVTNYTLLDDLYYKEYEGTGRNMFGCTPQIFGHYPDYITFERKFRCGNYTPAQRAHLSRMDEWGFVYNREKPFVDICIGIAAFVTIFGVPGNLVSLHFTNLCFALFNGVISVCYNKFLFSFVTLTQGPFWTLQAM